jgi:antitoxin MazE
MQVSIRPFGNSRGIVIPKALLNQLGLNEVAEMSIENDALVIRKPASSLRQGWAQAAQQIAESGQDTLVMGEFANDGDEALTW